MIRFALSKLKEKKAQDMVEFAIVLPFIMFIFLFILTGGQLIYNKQVAYNMAYQGCRSAVVSPASDAKALAKRRAELFSKQAIAMDSWEIFLGTQNIGQAEVKTDPSSWSFSPYTWNKKANAYCLCAVRIHMTTLFPIKGKIGATYPIMARTKMVIEYAAANKYDRAKEAVSIH